MASKPSRTIFTTSKSDELDVLERVMQFDPKRRPNASETLQIEYFSNPSAPCPSNCLPKPKENQPTESNKCKLGNDEKVIVKKRMPIDIQSYDCFSIAI
ncbi:unnamed protein product [Rotaria sp. Silwood1]|nr:unnamed protein product [Rotaria sp. Silwood1]CAF1634043.1 unnamed protein product [Rotaria sp. Silwood1]CAF3716950.1 unnamed protein product [Rotaria sp. Silwood1]